MHLNFKCILSDIKTKTNEELIETAKTGDTDKVKLLLADPTTFDNEAFIQPRGMVMQKW